MGMLIQNLLNVFFYFFPLIHTFSLISSSGATRIEIKNNCSYTVWAAATPGGGQRLKQGETWLLRNVSSSGRIWGRTKCTFGRSGTGGKCKSGDCEGRLKCETNGRPPITVAEYSLNQVNNDANVDVFYISVVEGFNVPMEFRPSEVSSDCSQVRRCAGEVNGACPTELIDPEGCNNPCTVFRNNQFCCTSGNICEPTSYSKFFKDLCQEAFTYPSDFGQRSTCPTGKDYEVVFCPNISYTGSAFAEQCGRRAGGTLCPNNLCCSEYGYCGSTTAYCGKNCQSQCGGSTPTTPSTPTPSGGGVSNIITRSLFDQMLKYRNDNRCPAHGFYTYDTFITAVRSFNGFGTTGDDATRKRELAAFFGQTSHETTGGWPSAPDGPYAWGYCFVTEIGNNDRYRGRGPFQLTYDFNYNQAGKAIGVDLINNPDLVATDPVVSFKTAIWFWMTPQVNKLSSHNVIVGKWTPSDADKSAGRVPGYGVITNIINGALECGNGQDERAADRIGFYKRYCDILGVSYGNNVDCYSQRPFT